MKGKFIVLEGIDGCGKTTQINELSKWLPKSGLIDKNATLIKTREPGGSILGREIRDMILNTNKSNSPSILTELLLYSADRAEHISKIIIPALQNGDWIISDRFSGSTLAYQGYGREISIDIIKKLENIVCQNIKPDLTFFLEISPEESIRRRRNKVADRIESEGFEFLEKVNHGFKLIALENNWEIIKASEDLNSISHQIQTSLINKFSKKSND
tara:strand:- start:127 stop:771 length:645 start_codon:yes stop_codon:yes gene_type:complete